ncbi:uncharacterized protein BO80DRAFT_412408 [Aspergillus ibericus CBS 121593]|uniref:Uncharacterized protein n=1 Tax=Aspergillus ibericus CBS 121593 TaxID=1448316 RepID=A0A395GU70_9EURO|nr:hypothetical protein BO80DRAFT_412408 [Aspergillus ibericus CBS 121593]RAK98508.1 hypothetical protein BO80DRAFT_412408 [Aspergillus ibericus CBS 121593]
MVSFKAVLLTMIPAVVAQNQTQIGSTTEFRVCSVDPTPIYAETCIALNETGATNISIAVGCRQYSNTECTGSYNTGGYRPGCYQNSRFIQTLGTISGAIFCFPS